MQIKLSVVQHLLMHCLKL